MCGILELSFILCPLHEAYLIVKRRYFDAILMLIYN